MSTRLLSCCETPTGPNLDFLFLGSFHKKFLQKLVVVARTGDAAGTLCNAMQTSSQRSTKVGGGGDKRQSTHGPAAVSSALNRSPADTWAAAMLVQRAEPGLRFRLRTREPAAPPQMLANFQLLLLVSLLLPP